MATASLNNSSQSIITGNDNIVITNVIETIRGGRTLDVTYFEPKSESSRAESSCASRFFAITFPEGSSKKLAGIASTP